MNPIVAILGRPNVGKSTLFNRLTRTQDALVDNFPGVTRDRHYGSASWNGVDFTVVDTGGFADGEEFSAEIRFQIDQAINEADAIVFVLDGRAGLSPFDRDLLDRLRGLNKPVFYAVNKIDGPEQEVLLADFFRLGLATLHPVSAEHRFGLNDFLDDLVAALPRPAIPPPADDAQSAIGLAVVGRPNVGKSSLINRILGEDRLVVSPRPGTTRNAIDSVYRRKARSYLLIDTAGIRRKPLPPRPRRAPRAARREDRVRPLRECRGRDPIALATVLDGLVLHSRDPSLLEMLGDLRDREERVDDALRAWREAFERAPNARLTEKIAKGERELAAGRDYAFAATAHLTVRHEGDLDREFAGAILDFLEDRWGDLTSAFRHAPSQPVTVILYPERAFRDVTQAPDEVGGLYDGKVRVPLGGVTRLDPALSKVLSHEI